MSTDKKTQMAKERDDKIANIKNMEREINEFRQTRERQLQEQALRMREGIVKEITDVVNDRVKSNSLDLVFDKSGMSLNGVPLLMYARETYDFTNDVISVLNKPGRASSLTTEKTSTSSTSSPSTSSTSPSSSSSSPTRSSSSSSAASPAASRP
jgi:outer membrane protein